MYMHEFIINVGYKYSSDIYQEYNYKHLPIFAILCGAALDRFQDLKIATAKVQTASSRRFRDHLFRDSLRASSGRARARDFYPARRKILRSPVSFFPSTFSLLLHLRLSRRRAAEGGYV